MTETPRKKHGFVWYILPGIVLVLALFIAVSIFRGKPRPPKAEQSNRYPLVSVISAKRTSYQPAVRTQGTVRPKRAIDLVPEVAGKIVWVAPDFVNGGRFKKNDVLIRIDPSNYKFAIEQARANVADAKAKLEKEVAEGMIAKQDWEDISGGKKATDLALRKPQLAGAKAALASAEARVHKAELDLARTEIRAPFNGRIDTKRVDVGQYVSPGTILAKVYATDTAEVYLPLTNSQLSQINLTALFDRARGQKDLPPVTLSANIGGKIYHWLGHIVRTSGSVDQNNRVLNLIVEVKDPYAGKDAQAPLMNGLFVNATIPGVKLDNVVEIPRDALRNEEQVVTVDSDNRMHLKRIQLINADQSRAFVRGIAPGTDIITSALDVVVDGMQVERSDKRAPENNFVNKTDGAETP